MTERQQVNLRLERELVDALDVLATAEHVDRTEVARRILVEGVQRSRVERALKDYASGRVTAWRAARDADVSLYDMLDRIHEAGIPYELDPEDVAHFGRRTARVAEAREPYGSSRSLSDDDTGIDVLRERYRPDTVIILFVGESSPAQGTHFYRANSNLYRATRAAFAEVFGEDVVPTDEAFLRFFRDRGCWLVDLADAPVNRLPDTKRRAAVERGVERLAELIRQTEPDRIVAIKRDIAEPVRRAMSSAGADRVALVVLPFPVRQWKRQYEDQLKAVLEGENAAPNGRKDARSPSSPHAQRSAPPDAFRLLRSLVGRPLKTISHGKTNRVLQVQASRFLVATDDSPDGAWERVKIIQDAIDRLYQDGRLDVNKSSLRHRRTALVGAVLVEMPGVTVASMSPRVLVLAK